MHEHFEYRTPNTEKLGWVMGPEAPCHAQRGVLCFGRLFFSLLHRSTHTQINSLAKWVEDFKINVEEGKTLQLKFLGD